MDTLDPKFRNDRYITALSELKKLCEEYVALQKKRYSEIKNPRLTKLLKEMD